MLSAQTAMTGSYKPFVGTLESGAWMHAFGRVTKGAFELKYVSAEISSGQNHHILNINTYFL